MWPFNKNKEIKEHPNGVAYMVQGGVAYTHREPRSREFVTEGYMHNVVVYRAIRELVNGIADVRLKVVDSEGKEQENHPAVDLLKNPNPTQGIDTFIKQLFVDYNIHGEMFLSSDNDYPLPPTELWILNPIDMDVLPGRGVPSAYIHEINNVKKKFLVDGMTGKSQVFFHKMYNPVDYWRGMSPLEAASLAGDTHNAGMKWNYSLLKNGARPSGIIKFEDTPSSETIARIREYFKTSLQGSSNAGEIPALSGGADWIEMQNNPRDMDYINTMKETTKYIAAAFGVPLPLIENDAASYNNIEQAKERLWTDTIIPMLNEFLAAFSGWLMPRYGDESLMICADMDDIPALEGVRARNFDRMVEAINSGLLTRDEARESLGYEPVGGLAESLFIPAGQTPIDLVDDLEVERAINAATRDAEKLHEERLGLKGASQEAGEDSAE